MSTFLRCCGDQMPVMFCDIQAAESAVDDGLAILRLWPSELNWSVAQLNVDVPGSFPFVQNEGSDPSNPPTVLTVAGWPNAPIAVNKTSKRAPVNCVCFFIKPLPSGEWVALLRYLRLCTMDTDFKGR